MKIWLHRISYHAEVSYPLIDSGYLSIGFSDFSESDFIADICEENGWSSFEKYFDDTWGRRPRVRKNLWRFVAEMEEGDWVVVPGWGSFSIYELTTKNAQPVSQIELSDIKDWHGNNIVKNDNGLLYREKGELVDLGFVRKVKPIRKDISRYDYADSPLTSRLKYRSTNANISDLKESIEKAIAAYDNGQPLNIYSQIISKTLNPIFETIKSQLTPDKFELLVKWYFQRIGASEVYVASKNAGDKDGDADVIAVFEPIKTIIYTQVKFHTGETSSWAIEQIKSYQHQKESMDDGYSKISWVVSTADNFSQESYDFAKEAKVQLIDGKQFTTMLLEAGIVNLDKAL